MRTWRDRRTARINAVWLFILATALLLSLALVTALMKVSGRIDAAASLLALLREMASSKAQHHPNLSRLAPEMPAVLGQLLPFVLLFGSLIFGAAWKARKMAVWMHDRCFAEFNHDVLRDIPEPKALDPLWVVPLAVQEGWTAMRWIDSEQRKAEWDQLHDFITKEIGMGQQPFHGDDTSFNPLSWAVITGQSGTGKTRMASQLAREFAGHERKRTVSRLGAWFRRSWPPAPRNPADPWEAGLLLGGKPEAEHADRPHASQEWLDELKAWRPRRPTILLLDDPSADDVLPVLGALMHRTRSFRFPVRLLIASQTLPAPLGIRQLPSSAWTSEKINHFSKCVVQLVGAQALSARDCGKAAGEARPRLPPRAWHSDEDQRTALRRLTRGNPLLLELAIHQMRMGTSLCDLSVSDLVRTRAERIIAALQAGGLGDDLPLYALAVATLVGGFALPAPTAQPAVEGWALEKGGGLRNPRWKSKPLRDLVPYRLLASVFSLDRADADHVPAVRPERIGDAFVRAVILHLRPAYPGIAGEIVKEAWHLGPRALLRSLPALLRDTNHPLYPDLVGGPPGDIGLDPVLIARAYAEVASLISLEDWNDHTYDAAVPVVAEAKSRIATLAPADAATLVLGLPDLFERPNTEGVTRAGPALICFAATARRAMDDPAWPPDPSPAINALARTIFGVTRWGTFLSMCDDALVSDLSELMHRLADRAPPCRSHPDWARWLAAVEDPHVTAWQFLHSIVHVAANPSRPSLNQEQEACRQRLAVLAVRLEYDPDFLAKTATLIDTLTRHLPIGAPPIDAILALGDMVTHAAIFEDPEAASASARRFLAFARAERLRGPAYEAAHARMWLEVAEARAARQDLLGCRRATVQARAIARRLPDPDAINRIECRALLTLSFCASRLLDSGTAQAAGEAIGLIAQTTPNDRRIGLDQASAWASVAVATSDRGEADREIRAIVERVTALPFSGEKDFERSRATITCSLAFVYANRGSPVDEVDRLAAQVWAIYSPAFIPISDCLLPAIRARIAVAYSARNDATRLAHERAWVEETIRTSFPHDVTFQAALAQVRSYRPDPA